MQCSCDLVTITRHNEFNTIEEIPIDERFTEWQEYNDIGDEQYNPIEPEQLIPILERLLLGHVYIEWWSKIQQKWVDVNHFKTEEMCWLSLGLDNHNYRTVTATGRKLTSYKK